MAGVNVVRFCVLSKKLFNSSFIRNPQSLNNISRSFSCIFHKSHVGLPSYNSKAYLTLFPAGCASLLKNYATDTDKINTRKILETTFPQKVPGDGSEPNNKGSQTNEDEEERQKRESSWRTMKLTLIAFATTFGLGTAWIIFNYGAPVVNEDGTIEEDEFTRLPIVTQYLKRAYSSIWFFTKMIQEPSRKKLLPDPVPPPYIQPPYTLVLEMTDVLVHPEWSYSTGWRFKKRPGLDQFLEQVGLPYFEIVIYTAEQGMIAFPLITSLDPNGHIMYRLFRDSTDYVDGHHVKNLDCLNRDLKRVIMVDWNDKSVKFHRANTFLIPRWDGNDSDTSLIDLAAFLQTIVANQVDDVREPLFHYAQFDNPLETFREKRRLLQEELEKEKEDKKKGGIFTLGKKSPFR